MKLQIAFSNNPYVKKEYLFLDEETFLSCMQKFANDNNYNFNDCRHYSILNTKTKEVRHIKDLAVKVKDLPIGENEYLMLSVIFR